MPHSLLTEKQIIFFFRKVFAIKYKNDQYHDSIQKDRIPVHDPN